MNSMLFRQDGLIVQDDTKLQIKKLKKYYSRTSKKNGFIDFMGLEILFLLFQVIFQKVLFTYFKKTF